MNEGRGRGLPHSMGYGRPAIMMQKICVTESNEVPMGQVWQPAGRRSIAD